MGTPVGTPLGVTASHRTKWTPTLPVTVDLVAHYDAADDLSVTMVAGGVSQWNDKSGAGNHLSVVAAGKEPGRTATQNGRSVLSFAAGDHMKCTPVAPIGATFAITVFQVFRKTGANNTFECAPVVLTSGGYPAPDDYWGPNWYLGGTGGMVPLGKDIQSATSWTAWAMEMSSPGGGGPHTARQYVDGVEFGSVRTGSGTWSTAGQAISVGRRDEGGTTFTGDIAELIIYKRVLSTTERQQVQTYAKQKWGTP